jgi:hypothetical protein
VLRAGLFFPESFLIAVLQSHAASAAGAGTAIDRLSLRQVVLPGGLSSIQQAPAVGVYVHGLFLEGAR